MHLIGFIIRIYHDARSPERQTPVVCGMAKFLLCREVSADKNAVKGKTK